MAEEQRALVHYFPDSINGGGSSVLMRVIKIVDGLRVRHMTRSLELHGVSYYCDGTEMPFLEDDELIINGGSYFLSPKDRGYTDSILKSWRVALRGIERRIADERFMAGS